MAWAGEGYEADFLKTCVFWVGRFFQNDLFHERGRRGRSRRENSAKILAAAFSRRVFLMVLGAEKEDPKIEIVELLKQNCCVCC